MDTKAVIKIIYVINDPKLYGSNKSLLNLLEGLINEDISPLVVMAMEGDLCNELKRIGIPYKIIPHQFSVYPDFPTKRLRKFVTFLPKLLFILFQNLIAVISLTRECRRFKADIIHTNIGPDHIGFLSAKITRIPHVWHIREYQDLHYKWHPIPSKVWFLRNLNNSFNYPIAISHGLFKHYNMGKNGRVIYNGIMKKTQVRFLVNKKKYFLFVGRLESLKGIRHLIDAFIEFAMFDDEFRLLIAGDGNRNFIDGLHQIITESGFSHRIDFLGFQSNVYDLMANATALLVPSIYEGFGRITVEAMFNGCLVIGNNSGGTKEIIEKENVGILYSGHEELVSVMKLVASKGVESYFHLITRAQERAKALYSVEQNVSAIYDLYLEVLNNKQSKNLSRINLTDG